MRLPLHHAEIMNVEARINQAHLIQHHTAQRIHASVIGDNGIHVDGANHSQLSRNLLFNVVDHIMRFINVGRAIHLNVHRGHGAAGAVIVNVQIMNPQRAGILMDNRLDGLHQSGIRLGSENVILGFGENLNAGNQNDDGHQDSHVGIGVKARDPRYHGAKQNARCGGSIGQAVHSGCLHHVRLNPLSNAPVQKRQKELYQHRQGKNDHGNGAEHRLIRRYQFADRLLKYLHTDEHDKKGNYHRGHIFNSRMPVGMLAVSRLGGNAKADAGNHGGTGIGKVVDRIGANGNRADQNTDQKFAGKQQQVKQNSHHADNQATAFAGRTAFRRIAPAQSPIQPIAYGSVLFSFFSHRGMSSFFSSNAATAF